VEAEKPVEETAEEDGVNLLAGENEDDDKKITQSSDVEVAGSVKEKNPEESSKASNDTAAEVVKESGGELAASVSEAPEVVPSDAMQGTAVDSGVAREPVCQESDKKLESSEALP